MKRTPLVRRTALRSASVLKRGPIKPRTTGLRQTRSTGKPTAAQADRFRRIRELGCVACRLRGRAWPVMEVEIHHLLDGGRRIGHDATIGLCHYHHQAKRLPWPDFGYSLHVERLGLGPSLEREPRRFREVFGQDRDLLALQNQLIKEQPA